MSAINSTKDYYDRYADEYFHLTCGRKIEPFWNKLDSRLTPDSLILDLGCGSGRDLYYFSSKGHRIVGLDYSFNLLKKAKEYSKQEAILADFSNSLPIRSNTFGAVWALGSLLHVKRPMVSAVLADINRILRPCGILFTAMKQGSGSVLEKSGRLNMYYHKDEWECLLKNANFTILETEVLPEDRNLLNDKADEKKINWIVCISKA